MKTTLALLFAFTLYASADPQTFPAVAPPKDPSAMGVGIQRTMTLLATSTPQHRNHVKILFYGQSITEQEWSKAVADDLRKRFPDADLEIENRAIGGFASQLLIRPAEHDLYPFYPDLLIFHVYGSQVEYEQIIKQVRTRTTAEVLMQTDHATQWPLEKTPAWPPNPEERKKDTGKWWDGLMNGHFLPEIAKKYGCALVDVRTPWVDYLKTNHLEPKDLLKDGVHLNAHGNFLMANLVSQYLVHRPDLKEPADQKGVTSFRVGQQVQFKDNSLKLNFDGNRVDLIASGPGKVSGRAKLLIDGRKPSEFPECYAISRSSPGPWSPLFISRVNHNKPLLLEEWTLKVTQVADDGKSFQYSVQGSETGEDGNGESTKPFTSNSGRVQIDPEALFRGSNPKLPVGYVCKWRVYPLFANEYESPNDSLRSGSEHVVTAAQNLPKGAHTLEVIAENGDTPNITEIRVYSPPVK